ncbi:hypothetical protein [Halosimplex sp. TS25]|uniref:hypothetical protein n=1 Tax=Halosimplex rarum TaxID=3396619 RepID=UPI0039E7F78B
MIRRVAVVAALAVVLAGCSAFAPTDGATTPRETVTPLPVPTDTPASGDAFAPPPGVAANGSVSPSALGAAHRRALDGRSFTWSVDHERRDLETGVTVDAVSKHLRVGSDGSYLFRTVRSPDRHQSLYAGDSGAYSRTVLGNTSTVRRLANAVDYRNYLTTSRSLQVHLLTEGANVARVEEGGQTFYRLHVTSPPPRVRDGHPKQTVRNYSATAYVTPAGLVASLVVRYDYELRADHVAVSLRADYGRVGETTVTRPEWATGTERDRAATATERPTSNATGTAPPQTDATPSEDR